jgi:hypothetical protein
VEIEQGYMYSNCIDTPDGPMEFTSTKERRFCSLYPGQLNCIEVSGDYYRQRAGFVTQQLIVSKVLNRKGEKEELWRADMPRFNESPTLLVADMNGDGVLDIVFSGWKGVVVFNSQTHEIIMDLGIKDWHNCRKRGQVLLRYITNDRYPDVVIMDEYPWDVNVIKNDGKKLSLAWFHLYDDRIESAHTVYRTIREPVLDINGDGKLEILYNVFNEQGDGLYHAVVKDAATGKDLFEIPGAFILDTLDLRKDGTRQILLQSSSNKSMPEFSRAFITDGTGRELCSFDNSGFVVNLYTRDESLLIAHWLQHPFLKYVVQGEVRGKTCFFIRSQKEGREAIKRYTLGENGAEEDSSFEISYPSDALVSLANAPKGSLIMGYESRTEKMTNTTFKGVKAELLAWNKKGAGCPLPYIVKLDGKHNSIVAENNVNQVARYDFDGKLINEVWTSPGRTPLAAADFVGRGDKQIALRLDEGPGTFVKLLDAQGKTIWTKIFPKFPSMVDHRLYSNEHGRGSDEVGPGLDYLTPAKDGEKTNLIVCGQRNVQHTAITYSLDGKTGAENWSIDKLDAEKQGYSGAGGFYTTTLDLNGDGAEEVITGYSNTVTALDGKTGKPHYERFQRGLWESHWVKTMPNVWVMKVSHIPVAREGDSTYFYTADTSNSQGLLYAKPTSDPKTLEKGHDFDADLVWGNEAYTYDGLDNQCAFLLKDSSGLTKTLIAEPCLRVSDQTMVMHAIDPLTGEIIGEELPIGGGMVPIAADIDGDGMQEIVYTQGAKLGALRFDGRVWHQLWTLEMKAGLSWPVYGDVDGDGLGEIVLTDTDGMLYVVK